MAPRFGIRVPVPFACKHVVGHALAPHASAYVCIRVSHTCAWLGTALVSADANLEVLAQANAAAVQQLTAAAAREQLSRLLSGAGVNPDGGDGEVGLDTHTRARAR